MIKREGVDIPTGTAARNAVHRVQSPTALREEAEENPAADWAEVHRSLRDAGAGPANRAGEDTVDTAAAGDTSAVQGNPAGRTAVGPCTEGADPDPAGRMAVGPRAGEEEPGQAAQTAADLRAAWAGP